jgi:hypothetical protein
MAHGQQIQVAPFDPVGDHTRNATLNAAVDLSALRPANSDKILIQCDTQNVRYTLDGTTPTATVGFLLLTTDSPTLIAVSDTTVLQVIAAVGGAVINYIWGT